MGQNSGDNSVDTVSLLVEFLEVAVHQILFTRRLYPTSIFVLKKKYNIPIRVSIHPGLNSYIKQTLRAVRTLTESQQLQSFALTFYTRDCIPIEKHVFDVLKWQGSLSGRVENCDPYLIQLQESLRDYCLKLGVGEFKALPEDCSFRLIIKTTEQGSVAVSRDPNLQEHPLVTMEDHEHNIENRLLVPVYTISSDFFRVQTYYETENRHL